MHTNITLDGFFGIFIRILCFLTKPSTTCDNNEATIYALYAVLFVFLSWNCPSEHDKAHGESWRNHYRYFQEI